MTRPEPDERRGWAARALGLGGGLVVALGAGVATAHGLYEVAIAAHVSTPLAWLYPLITDGLALVAYASTARLTGQGRRYAWAVVVLAAGLSGLAQATYLAGGVGAAPPMLRFGVGAWPAIAAAIVAHLLFLLGTDTRPSSTAHPPANPPAVHPELGGDGVQPTAVHFEAVQPPAAQLSTEQDPAPFIEQPSTERPSVARSAVRRAAPRVQPSTDRAGGSALERARSAARRHVAHHRSWPTVRQLADAAEVGNGTAAAALKELRDQLSPLHVVPDNDEPRTQP